VRGILVLGRYLIWLSVFLIFYSSFMVLIQYGARSYAPKMISGWGSIAQEFEKSFHTLSSAPAATATGDDKAPADGKTTDGGKPAKPGEVPGFVSILVWGSVVTCLLGFFWMVAVAFQESMLWGLGVLFIPFLAVIFWLTHFREATPPLVIWVIGAGVQFFVFAHYSIDFQEYFLGAPTPPPTPQPNPLEGMIMPLVMFLLS
jgi:hypothetical protein